MTPHHFYFERSSDAAHPRLRGSRRLSPHTGKSGGGYTLIELMVAVGLFAFVMTLTAGAYFMMISISRRTQALASGVDNLSFALESMTRTIRTGNTYSCDGIGDCSGGSSFSVKKPDGSTVRYALSSQAGEGGNSTVGDIVANGVTLTSSAVDVTALDFYTSGTSKSDALQPFVRIMISGTVILGPGKTEPFTVETSATMRGTDL